MCATNVQSSPSHPCTSLPPTCAQLTKFIDDDYDAVLAKDCNGPNVGSLLLRSTQWVEALLAECYTRPVQRTAENGAFVQVWQEVPGVAQRIKVFNTTKSFNSYQDPLCGSVYTPGALASLPTRVTSSWAAW